MLYRCSTLSCVSVHTDGASGLGRMSPALLRYRTMATSRRRRSTIAEYLGPSLQYSGIYFYSLLWSCIALTVYNNVWMLSFLLVPLVIVLVRVAESQLHLWRSCRRQACLDEQITVIMHTGSSKNCSVRD